MEGQPSPSTSAAPSEGTSSNQSESPAPKTRLNEVVFVDTSAVSPAIRVGGASTSVSSGERFASADDGAFLAILQNGSLSLIKRDGGTQVQRIPGVTWFAWRPGTHDLLYIVRSSANPKAEWHIRTPDGRDSVFGTGAATAMISPEGSWFVAVHRPGEAWELVAVSLHDLKATQLPGNESGFAELKWAGRDVVAFLDGSDRV